MTDRDVVVSNLKDVLFSARKYLGKMIQNEKHSFLKWIGESTNLPRRSSSSLGRFTWDCPGFSNCLSLTNGNLKKWWKVSKFGDPNFQDLIFKFSPTQVEVFVIRCNQSIKLIQSSSRWWLQIFFMFTPIWARFRFWLIFFRWVENTNQLSHHHWFIWSNYSDLTRPGAWQFNQFNSIYDYQKFLTPPQNVAGKSYVIGRIFTSSFTVMKISHAW